MKIVVIPYLDAPDLTRKAVADALAQGPDVQLLLIDNGSQQPGLDLGLELAAAHPNVLRWRHDPALPSLSALWNRALQFAWEAGAEEALLVNNDIEMWHGTYDYLAAMRGLTDALFVSATGVTGAQYRAWLTDGATPTGQSLALPGHPLPGPDFSCYLITKACHEQYPFDEGYTPAYCEDLDYHRRLMLGGDGARIFGTGLPFLHVGSGTLSSMSPEARAKWERRIEQGSRAHHFAKWYGGANQERLTVPFDMSTEQDGVATHELFARVRNGQDPLI